MDVRCSKCGTEYEFDDAKVTGAGVTVKCTNCGHVFKVKRDESSSVPPSPSTSFGGTSFGGSSFQPQSTFAKGMDGGEWMVKRVDGQVFRFKELTTLQKWIVERKVGRDDEISKTGKTWKKLGEIAELASFFQVVDAANAALAASAPIGVAPALAPAMRAPGATPSLVVMPPTNPGAVPGPPQPSAAFQATFPGTPATQPTPITAAQAAQAAPAPTPSQQVEVEKTGQSIHDLPTEQIRKRAIDDANAQRARELSAPKPAPPKPAPPPRQPTPAPRIQEEANVDSLDESDPVLQMIKRRRRNAAVSVIIVLLLAGGVAGAVFWPQLSPLLGLAPAAPTTVPAVEDARKALRGDKLDEIRKARETLVQSPKGTPLIVATIVRLDVADAAHKNELARLTEVLGDAADAKKLREQATSTLANAYAALNKVRTDAPGLVDGNLASAAYQLERGGLAEQRADLEAARAAAKGDASVDAEIAVQQALADAKAALTGDAKAALDKVPASPGDGRLAYARAALAVAAFKAMPKPGEPDVLSTKAALAQLPPGDERVALLAKVVDSTGKPAAAVVDAGPAPAATVDAGVPAKAEPEKKEPEKKEPEKKEPEKKEPVKAVASNNNTGGGGGGGAKSFIQKGWSAMDGNRNSEAAKDFKKALEIDPNSAEAEFGLAEAQRYSGNKAEAIEAYKTYLKMAPNGKEAGTAKRAIDALQ
jgi:predicted Zn finger-like uncharacterized protein